MSVTLEPLLLNAIAAIFAFLVAYHLYGHENIHRSFIQRGLCGKDLNKATKPVMWLFVLFLSPESMGVVCGLIYLVTTFLLIPALFLSAWHQEHQSILSPTTATYDQLTSYLSALLSLTCMTFLGFADDVFDLRWRYKLLLPTIASIPLLTVYYVSSGVTHIVIPSPFQSIFGKYFDLGVFYYVYMGMLAVFCTNSINILAGINGVEVGQSLVIALSIAINDLLYVASWGRPVLDRASWTTQTYENHLFSLHLILPFIAVTFALYLHNRHPARVFVGDTFCYFAGMTFAVVGILGHYSKTMLLFFIPQIFNFLYSIPQLFRWIPCPRHRMPRFDPDTGLMYPSMTRVVDLSRKRHGFREQLGWQCVQLFAMLGFARIEKHYDSTVDPTAKESKQSPSLTKRHQRQSLASTKDERKITAEKEDEGYWVVNNLTLLNLLLVWFGPMSERQLCRSVLLVQMVMGTAFTFCVRYYFVRLVYW